MLTAQNTTPHHHPPKTQIFLAMGQDPAETGLAEDSLQWEDYTRPGKVWEAGLARPLNKGSRAGKGLHTENFTKGVSGPLLGEELGQDTRLGTC